MLKTLMVVAVFMMMAVGLRLAVEPGEPLVRTSPQLTLLGYEFRLDLGVRRAVPSARASQPDTAWPVCKATVDTIYVRAGGLR